MEHRSSISRKKSRMPFSSLYIPVDIHPRHRHHVERHHSPVVVKLLVGTRGRFRDCAPSPRVFQPVLLLPVRSASSVCVSSSFCRALHDGREDRCLSPPPVEEHDADHGKWAASEDVHCWLSPTIKLLPGRRHEERAQPGDAFATPAMPAHSGIICSQSERRIWVKVVEPIGYQYLSVHVLYSPTMRSRSFFFFARRQPTLMFCVVAYEVAVMLHLEWQRSTTSMPCPSWRAWHVHHVLFSSVSTFRFFHSFVYPRRWPEFLHREVVAAQHLRSWSDVRDVAATSGWSAACGRPESDCSPI